MKKNNIDNKKQMLNKYLIDLIIKSLNEEQKAQDKTIESSCIELMDSLFKEGADANCRDEKGISPLYYAIKKCHENNIELFEKIFKFLIKKGADVNFQDNHGNAPLHCAVNQCHERNPEIIADPFERVFQLLIQAGADINQENDDRLSPVHIAEKSKSPRYDIASALIEMYKKSHEKDETNGYLIKTKIQKTKPRYKPFRKMSWRDLFPKG